MSPEQRRQAVGNARLCYACLGPHLLSQCKTTYSCRTCHNKSHHTLLHQATIPKTDQKPGSSTSLTCQQPASSTTVLLGTAAAQVQCASGLWHPVRILIDPASMVSFVTNSLAQSLNLPRSEAHSHVTGLGNTPVPTLQSAVKLRISPTGHVHSPLIELNASVIPRISAEIPAKAVPIQVANQFKNLADYSIFKKPSKVDILIGAAHYGHLCLPGQPLIQGEPNCLPTIFGNVLLGEVPQESDSSAVSLFVQSDPLTEELKRFWESEEVPVKKFASPDDMYCEKHFEETHSRNDLGQFVVRLPFKSSPVEIGSTRNIALKQFYSLERRLDNNDRLKDMYHANIQDYVDKDQIEVASTPSPVVLPHHAILKESSSSPLRVVFNASQPSSTNQTLNNAMHIGPKLQHDVGDILLSFCMNKVAVCGDIRQMYRAVLIHPDDRRYQHIFWRFSKNEPVEELELKRLTFGFAPASYLAQKCLRTLATYEKDKYPAACQALMDSCYVDDIVTGAATPQEARELCEELVALLRSGGFELKKFASSSPEVLAHIPLEDQEQSLILHDTSTIKVLGLRWDPNADCFCYTINIKSQQTVTKRTLLSHVASIFDINGYLTHLVIFLKILIQKIWITKGDWDDPLPSHLLKEWNDFVRELPCISDLRIPRYMNDPRAVTYQLVGFSDASSAAMAASVYLRIQSCDGTILTNLLRAKSKVAPLKTMSIPRLELCAAHLLIKLLESLNSFIQSIQIEKITCFTDSTTVLAWLQTPPYQLKVFVANRVASITEKVHPEHWRYVPTSQNPADLATRGLLPSQVIAQYEFWFHGPTFLLQSPESWPDIPSSTTSVSVPELKPQVSLVSHQTDNQEPFVVSFIQRFSSLIRLQRIMAWILRFKQNCLNIDKRQHGPLTHHEITAAMTLCVKATQQFYFADVIKELTQGKQHLGSLKSLSPILDPSGLLMVGGRLKNAPLPAASKHPLLLPSKSHLAVLIVDHLHLYSLHGGVRLIQNLLLRQYWVIASRNLIKSRVFACLKCYKLSASTRPQYMGDLPVSRFEQGRCFINTALDFAGPYLLKSGPRRNSPVTKAYIAVFVCMAVKAVHLELANSLTTESCLAAIDRYVARRGKPSMIHSDQGTNFKGSARHMSEVDAFLYNAYPHLHEHFHSQGISWKFHPPGAPNFSGLAEAGVKSAKLHLSRILDDRPLYQEEFCTLLCQVEAVLNSRPLVPLSSLPDDGIDYLTPGHFLVGGPLLARPEVDVTDRADNSLTRWKLLSKITQQFWKRWLSEYLHTLMQRTKWHCKRPNLKVNDVVYVLSENSQPRQWPIARVIRVNPGQDGVVRVAEVQTPHGILTRPVSKLLPLPIH
uniref:Integrase catalytic domain-containing protein n=1 Tax=Cacopsylla melanoneura TaxID=428564 RepID=A0A8D9BBX1_9HEMI